MFNETYEVGDVTENSDDVDDQARFVRRYWGSIVNYIDDIDYDTLGELFEHWCEDEAAKLTLPEFTNIAVVEAGQTGQLVANTIYLCTDQSIDSVIANEIYAEQLQAVLAKANKELRQKALFSEFQQGGDQEKIHRYERWLDAALLADMLTYVDSTSYDRLGIFVDLLATDKPCWAGFQKVFGSVGHFHTTKLHKKTSTQSDTEYDEANYDKTELKPAFDRIGTYVRQGRGLINNVATRKLAGVR